MRRKPGRRRRRRAGEADGRSGFRLSPQRRRRRRERRGEREAEEGEATSLPGPRAARDAGTQEEEEDGEEEEAVAAAPHAHTHTGTASPPPDSARRCRTACWEREAGRAPAQPGHRGGAWRAGRGGAGPGGGGGARGPPSRARGTPPLPANLAKVPRPAAWAAGRGHVCHPCPHPLPARPGRHLTLESRTVSGQQASTPRPGVPARAHLSHPVRWKVKIKKKKGRGIHLANPHLKCALES